MRLPVLFAAPHRPMFLAGTVQALAVMMFWSLELGGRYLGLWPVPAWPVLTVFPPPVLHALLLSCGVFPFFMFGFILTAGPRWQGAGELAQRDFVPAFALLACGWLLVWIAFLLPSLLVAGLALALAGWVGVALRLTGLARHRTTDREHISFVALAAWLGVAGMGAFAVFAAGGVLPWARLGIALAVWGFLLPVFLAVAHRMLPFFTSSAVRNYVVRRPQWALRSLIGLSFAHGGLAFLELFEWLWLADLPAMLVAVRLTWLWWSRAALANRMLSVLHVAFAWLSVAFALFAMQSLLRNAVPGFLGQAPLHALTLGFFASMLVGMASRVTMGHSGRPLAADAVMWGAFCMMQAAAIVRAASELPALPGAYALMWLSSLLWLGAFGLWAWRYAPFFWRARADGKPG
ncbi:MAG: NnrS family protein [Betaproteobacteria bacterium]|nr:NnrS family protein [Betaproteobacteria bacterium]